MPGHELAGFLLIDKPEGISSFDVIRRLRKITGMRRIGHTGTLDPFATGLLICCLGVYTRLAQYLEASIKSYEATITFGSVTDSADLTGTVVKQSELPSPTVDLEQLKTQALGLTSLPVPAYSAIKIDGKRAYKYAREGEVLEMPDRAVCISEFETLAYSQTSMTYRCTVSKGTYIRSLSEWIAQQLNSTGHTSVLRRISIGETKVESASRLEDFETRPWQDSLYNPIKLFSGFASLTCSPEEMSELRMGRTIESAGVDIKPLFITDDQGLIHTVAERIQGIIKPRANL